MPTYKEAIEINEQYALDNGMETTGIKILMMHFSKISNSDLFARLEEEMPAENYKAFLRAVEEYVVNKRPVQHITGTEYFYGYTFFVNEDVLIPRFETEELVANVLMFYDEYFENKPVNVVDIGTGSGCLSITLDKEEQNMTVSASDISEKAIAVAKKNNDSLGANVTFRTGDMLEPFYGETFDILVSNPPYIPAEEQVEALVKDNEPHVALFGGEDGLDFYRVILKNAQKILNDKFMIAFEHAYDKASELKGIVQEYFSDVEIIQKKDMQGKDRMTFIIKK